MDDLINRQAAIDVIEKWLECSDYNEAERHIMRATESILYDLPSVNQQEPCEDAISRQALLDAFGFSEKTRKWGGDHSGYNTMMLYEIQDIIESQPPVNPQEKTGHWINISNKDLHDYRTGNKLCFECSECRSQYTYKFNHCPNCGMVEPQERSE